MAPSRSSKIQVFILICLAVVFNSTYSYAAMEDSSRALLIRNIVRARVDQELGKDAPPEDSKTLTQDYIKQYAAKYSDNPTAESDQELIKTDNLRIKDPAAFHDQESKNIPTPSASKGSKRDSSGGDKPSDKNPHIKDLNKKLKAATEKKHQEAVDAGAARQAEAAQLIKDSRAQNSLIQNDKNLDSKTEQGAPASGRTLPEEVKGGGGGGATTPDPLADSLRQMDKLIKPNTNKNIESPASIGGTGNPNTGNSGSDIPDDGIRSIQDRNNTRNSNILANDQKAKDVGLAQSKVAADTISESPNIQARKDALDADVLANQQKAKDAGKAQSDEAANTIRNSRGQSNPDLTSALDDTGSAAKPLTTNLGNPLETNPKDPLATPPKDPLAMTNKEINALWDEQKKPKEITNYSEHYTDPKDGLSMSNKELNAMWDKQKGIESPNLPPASHDVTAPSAAKNPFDPKNSDPNNPHDPYTMAKEATDAWAAPKANSPATNSLEKNPETFSPKTSVIPKAPPPPPPAPPVESTNYRQPQSEPAPVEPLPEESGFKSRGNPPPVSSLGNVPPPSNPKRPAAPMPESPPNGAETSSGSGAKVPPPVGKGGSAPNSSSKGKGGNPESSSSTSGTESHSGPPGKGTAPPPANPAAAEAEAAALAAAQNGKGAPPPTKTSGNTPDLNAEAQLSEEEFAAAEAADAAAVRHRAPVSNDPCSTSDTINNKYACQKTLSNMENTQNIVQMSAMLGGTATTALGAASTAQAGSSTDQKQILTSAAQLEINTGGLQTAQGGATTIMGAYLMAQGAKHNKNATELEQMTEGRFIANPKTGRAMAFEGGNQASHDAVANHHLATGQHNSAEAEAELQHLSSVAVNEQRNTAAKAKSEGLMILLQGLSQTATGALTLSAGNQMMAAANKYANPTPTPAFTGGPLDSPPPVPDTSAGPGGSPDTSASIDAGAGSASAGSSLPATADAGIPIQAPPNLGTGNDGNQLPNNLQGPTGPVADAFTPGAAPPLSGGGDSGGFGGGGGNVDPLSGDSSGSGGLGDPGAPQIAQNTLGDGYLGGGGGGAGGGSSEGGGSGGGGGGSGGEGANGGGGAGGPGGGSDPLGLGGLGSAGGANGAGSLDLKSLLASFLPKKDDAEKLKGILDFGNKSANPNAAPPSLLDKNVNIFERIHNTYQDKQKHGAFN